VGGRARGDAAPDHPGLHLIQRIRDEAHRFAIAGHRRDAPSGARLDAGGHSRDRRQTPQAAAHAFRGLKGVMGASVEDLTQVEGISRKLAEKIYRELHAA